MDKLDILVDGIRRYVARHICQYYDEEDHDINPYEDPPRREQFDKAMNNLPFDMPEIYTPATKELITAWAWGHLVAHMTNGVIGEKITRHREAYQQTAIKFEYLLNTTARVIARETYEDIDYLLSLCAIHAGKFPVPSNITSAVERVRAALNYDV